MSQTLPRPPVPSSAKDIAELLRSSNLLEALPDALVAVEQDGTIVQVNSLTEELFGYGRQELIGQKVELLVPERYRRNHQGHRADFVQTPKIRRMGAGLDLFGRRRDGSEFPVEISLSPLNFGSGSLVLSAIRDVSDQKGIEEELRRAHHELDRRTAKEIGEYRGRLASIVDSSEDAIIGKSLDGTITSWNRGAERTYGYTSQEIVGKNIAVLAPKDRPDEIPQILENISRGQSVEPFETIRVTKDGRRLNMSISVSPIRDAGGRVMGASAIARDITAQKRAEDHLRQAQKMEAIGRLAGGIAHDFNNILGIITACTELLRSRIEANSEPAQYIANMRKAVDRGASLTRQLLAFGRKSVIQAQVLDLNERLRETSKLLRPLMGEDVEIVINARSPSAIIEADPGQLDQIVLNLAVNARDAMPHGGKFILETSTAQLDETFGELHRPMTPGRYVLLAVSDTGVGMDAATVSRIFEPFFTTKEVGKGTGLGLATVYGIVQQAGGHIWVYSEVHRGTTFKIYLPSAEHKVGVETDVEAEAVPARREGVTVLVVEDDELMRRLTRQLLEEHGYRILEAKDAAVALGMATELSGQIDILLTDVVMRGMSGPELVARLRESRPGLRAVYMSGYTGELIAGPQNSNPDIPLLEKPFTRASLLRIIDQTLGAPAPADDQGH
jgi:two-component system, cell cycle sensor histidine kinase and response regulator CckA